MPATMRSRNSSGMSSTTTWARKYGCRLGESSSSLSRDTLSHSAGNYWQKKLDLKDENRTSARIPACIRSMSCGETCA